MKAIFDDLTNVLSKLHPPINPKFAAPANEQAIRQAEAALNVEFVDDLKAFLLCADGQAPDGYWFAGDPILPRLRFGPAPEQLSAWGCLLGADKIVEHTLAFREIVEEMEGEEYESHGPAHYHAQYIIISAAEDPVTLGIDLRPQEGGTVGQIVTISDQPNDVAVIAPSLKEFLRAIADGYRDGRFKLRENGTWCDA